MKLSASLLSSLAFGVTLAMTAQVAVAHDGHMHAPKSTAEFDQLKGLVGDWEGTMGSPTGKPSTTNFKLTAGGSALVETMAVGTPYEMVNVYHLDGDHVAMTHYCASGNQPTMKLQKVAKPGVMHFGFVSATNLPSAKASHMHEMAMKMVDKDHLETDWASFEGGKDTNEHAKFWLKRKK